MNLHLVDILIVGFYIIIILYTGFVLSRKKELSNSSEEYILAGRKLTLPFFVATLVATWYGSILGIGEFVYTSGIVAWICFGVPYYIAAFLFAKYISKKIRASNVHTIPEQITNEYGNYAGKIASIIILVITIPAVYILMLGVIIQMFSGLSLELSIIIGVIISLVYIYNGGFKADVLTNSIQFIFMYIGFGALLFFTIVNLGPISEMTKLLPENHLHFKGEYSIQYVLAWFIIAFQTFVDPSFHQRCSAAKTPETAQKGIYISIIFWIIFDFFTLTTGLYARAFFPIDNPIMTFPILGESVLPLFWKGIFVVAMISAVMSTLDSYAFISAITIGNDLLGTSKRLLSKFTKLNTRNLTQIGLVLTGIVGIIMAISLPSVVQLIYNTSSIAVPGLIFPLIISMNSKYKIDSKNAIKIMIFSSLTSFFWLILKSYEFAIFIELEPMFAGISIAFILTLIWIKKR